MGRESIQSSTTTVASPGRARRADLEARFAGGDRPLLLDGATGTELERAGVHTGLPLWSTHALIDAPDAVRDVHAAYVRAGAEIVTANTFRTQARTLERAGLPASEDLVLTRRAVELVREAIASEGAGPSSAAPGPWVAGSLPPLEDCYAPDRVPDPKSLDREHRRQVEVLGKAGVDLLLIETMNAAREASSAVDAAAASGLPFVVSFVSWRPGRLLSGDDLAVAARHAIDSGARAVGVNCVPPSSLAASLECLAQTGLPLLVSPNLGEPNDATGFTRSESCDGEDFVAQLEAWLALPALRIVGGCCGTTPDHVAALARRLRD